MNKQVWFSRRALRLHAVILVVVPGFMALCIWQVYRAVGGNELSWAYVFEWPFFAAYAIYMWWRFVHEAPEVPAAVPAGGAEDVDPGGAARESRGLVATGDAGGDGGPGGDGGSGGDEDAVDDDPGDAELAAYNDYLAQLAARDKASGR